MAGIIIERICKFLARLGMVPAICACTLGYFHTKAGADKEYNVTCDGIDYILTVYYNSKMPIEATKTEYKGKDNKPPERSQAEMCTGWEQGYELARMYCDPADGGDDYWYWVKFECTLTPRVPEIASTTISPASASLNVGETQVFTATARDTEGNDITADTYIFWGVVGGIGTVSPSTGSSTTFTATTAGSGIVDVHGTYEGKTVGDDAKVTVSAITACTLEYFHNKAGADKDYAVVCNSTNYTLRVYYNSKMPLEATKTEYMGPDNKPPPRSQAEMCAGWKAGWELSRMYCDPADGGNNYWYWVKFECTLTPA